MAAQDASFPDQVNQLLKEQQQHLQNAQAHKGQLPPEHKYRKATVMKFLLNHAGLAQPKPNAPPESGMMRATFLPAPHHCES